MKNGKGKWRKDGAPNSNNYAGAFEGDVKHGYGVFVWESGNYYKGYYYMDNRGGYGEMYWNDGSIYKGQWKDG